ncbi:hypothetical protein Bca4012_057406 [Brassica carinata]|uniref:Uncharacterized protein n=1 Tax=Brassica carinata TaxID=52824 RepID=A0A8X7W2X7_BRACI|nr:hypothetical protein Bca52824_014728 [Brassica carinata]
MQASAPADVSETSLSSLLDDKFLRNLSDVRDVDEALKIVTIDSDPTAAVYQYHEHQPLFLHWWWMHTLRLITIMMRLMKKMMRARAKEEDKGRRAEKSSAVHKV